MHSIRKCKLNGFLIHEAHSHILWYPVTYFCHMHIRDKVTPCSIQGSKVTPAPCSSEHRKGLSTSISSCYYLQNEKNKKYNKKIKSEGCERDDVLEMLGNVWENDQI